MNHQRINFRNTINSRFYQMPEFLFTHPNYENLSNNAKVMYMLMKNRFNLSIENNWEDKNGDVYLIFTITELEELIKKSNKTVIKIKKELIDIGLIEEERQGKNKPNFYYLTEPDFKVKEDKCLEPQGSVKITLPEVKKLHLRKCKNYTLIRSNNNNINLKKDDDDHARARTLLNSEMIQRVKDEFKDQPHFTNLLLEEKVNETNERAKTDPEGYLRSCISNALESKKKEIATKRKNIRKDTLPQSIIDQEKMYPKQEETLVDGVTEEEKRKKTESLLRQLGELDTLPNRQNSTY